MGWRTVVITKRCKLEFKLNYLVVRGEETTKIFLPEIGTLILESTAVALTAVLLSELIKQKINVIFCDEKHNPLSQLLPLSASFDTARKIQEQIAWDNTIKTTVWTQIVTAKIEYQAKLLQKMGLQEFELLFQYCTQVQPGDVTNREGHAAKVYFNALFGKDFSRDAQNNINSILNYGYTILLSALNREIAANGYLSALGLNHKNPFNSFNFACDLMEPFRIIIDEFALSHLTKTFDVALKHELLDVFNQQVTMEGNQQTVQNAIGIYCKSVFDCLNQEKDSKMKWYEL